MKRNVFNFMAMFFVAVLTLGFTSCGDDDDGGNDPEGTITANIRNKNNGETYVTLFDGYSSLRIDAADNFWFWDDHSAIACIGKVKGLGSINSIPISGWSVRSLVQPGYGYVVKSRLFDGIYARIYVVDYMEGVGGGIIGATVKYQSPWEP
ncbi:MAG: DUF5036 family protein [Bacteroidaceae bacterium]|nr:DUF5036 family protein [Bacteroidaceae bacterium]